MKKLLKILPLIVGPAVLVSIFFIADISFNDRTFEATVLSVDESQASVEIERSDAKKQTLPLSASLVFREDGTFYGQPKKAVGSTQPFVIKGIISQITGVGISAMALVVALTILALVMQAWRLAILYSCGGHHAKWRHAFRALLIGLLYGNVLPAGQVGGDPIKAFYLAKLTDGKRTHALAAAMIDRALGLAVLAAIAGVAILLGAVEINDPKMRYLVLAVLAVGLIGTAALLSSKLRKAIGLSAIVSKLPLASVREKLGRALREVSASPSVLAMALLLSVLAHLSLIAAVFVVAQGIGLGLPFSDFVAKVPVANIVASLPLAPPGGWGFGEWAYMLLFSAIGAEAAFTLSALPRLAMLFVSLWGALASWHLPPKPEQIEEEDADSSAKDEVAGTEES